MKLYYRIVSYQTPKGIRFCGMAWNTDYPSVRIDTIDCESYTGARIVLDSEARRKVCELAYFDGEYTWSPEKGFQEVQ